MELCIPRLEALAEMGVDEKSIYKESFYVDLDAKEEELKSKGKLSPELTREIEVVLEGQSYSFEVPAGKTILEAGLDRDINMPYSCQSGLCTACRGKLISGKVDMIEDAGLSESEMAAGYILCCSSKPASSDIKILIE
jgi:ring-1,2-phenylacetyl-CoA epoxidase subunit PaaE